MGLGQILLIAAGIVLFLTGGWLLASRPAGGSESRRGVRWFGEPTRLSLGIVGLGLGYHLAVWGSPWAAQAVAVPAERWWWVVVPAVVWAAGSLIMDRVEGRPPGGDADGGGS